MKKITKRKQQELINLKKIRSSISEISQCLNVSESTVKRYTKNIEVKKRKNKGGRPKKLFQEITSILVKEYADKKLNFLIDGKRLLEKKFEVKCTRQTVKNYLNSKGYKCYIKRNKPLLTDNHKKKRLDFARKFSKFSYFDWKNVIWSDVSTFSLINTNQKELYWNAKAAPLKDENIKKSLKFGRDSLMVWGCITSEGVGELIRLPKSVTSNVYVSCLEDGLIKTIEKFSLNHEKVIFMQDNAPVHVSKTSKKWLSDNRINLIDWPPQSPDMNPIENIWDYLDKKVRERVEKPRNLDELWELIRQEWYKIDKDLLRKLYLSMLRRIQSLKEAKGGYTKY
jgi:transposase